MGPSEWKTNATNNQTLENNPGFAVQMMFSYFRALAFFSQFLSNYYDTFGIHS